MTWGQFSRSTNAVARTLAFTVREPGASEAVSWRDTGCNRDTLVVGNRLQEPAAGACGRWALMWWACVSVFLLFFFFFFISSSDFTFLPKSVHILPLQFLNRHYI